MRCEFCGALVNKESEVCPNCNKKQVIKEMLKPESKNNCEKCGYELQEGWIVCPQCQHSINKNPQALNLEEANTKSKESIYILVYLICVAMGLIIRPAGGIAFIVAFIAIVTGFIKCPKSRAIKVLFWLTVAYFLLMVIVFLFLIITCTNTMRNCG